MSDQIVRASDEHAASPPLPAAVGTGHRSSRTRPRAPYAGKFRFATALLVGVALGAIGIMVAVLLRSTTKSDRTVATAPPWSSWRPPDNGTLGAREIADYIAPFYRLSAVDQLALITVVNVISPNASAIGTTNGVEIAVQNNPSSNSVELLGGNTVAYNLCGIGGTSCEIPVGTPSTSRLLLLRREALELSLYTFKYISGVNNVLVILPPGRETTSACVGLCKTPHAKTTTKQIDIAVLFLRAGVAPLLERPLSDTFVEPYPPTVNEMTKAPEAGLVDQITAQWLFSEETVQAQDGSNLLVLNPLPPE